MMPRTAKVKRYKHDGKKLMSCVMNRVSGSMTVIKDTMSGKNMIEGVDSVMDREKVANGS